MNDGDSSGVFQFMKGCTGIIGRDEEFKILKQEFERVLSKGTAGEKTSVILIDGPTGVGKTTLATSLRDLVNQHDGLFCMGKFDQLTQQMNASSVCTTGLDSILSDIYTGGRAAGVMQAITEDLSGGNFDAEELDRLLFKFPTLAKFLAQGRSTQPSPNADVPTIKEPLRHDQKLLVSSNATMGMLKKSLRLLRRAIGRAYPVTVVLFDDLHWADEAMLGVFSALCDDSVAPTTIFIGSYRSDQTNLAFSRILDRFRHMHGVCFTEIHLQGISTKAISMLAQSAIGVPVKFTRDEGSFPEFVDVLFHRTAGLIFYIREFLFVLESSGTLLLNDATATCDLASMKKDFGSSLEDLLVFKLSRLRFDVLYMLRMASCLGTRVDKDILAQLLHVEPGQVTLLLQEAYAHGILARRETEEQDCFVWMFSHDAFREAVYDILPKQEQVQLHHEIGLRLSEIGNGFGYRDLLLVTAAQLILGAAAIPDKNIEVTAASICLKACESATQSSRFWTARDLVFQGINMLERRSSWGENYCLFLQLYDAAAEISYCTGHLKDAHDFADVVLREARCQQDSYRAHAVKIYSFGGDFKFECAIDHGLRVLRNSFGIHVPNNSSCLRAWLTIRSLRKRIQRDSFSSLLRMKPMHDIELLTTMHLLNILFIYCYLNDVNRAVTVGTLMVDLTLKHGGGPFSFVGFGVLGAIFCSPPFTDVDFGCKMGELAVFLFEEFSSKTWYARMIALTVVGTASMKQPVPTTFDLLEKANRIGLCYGDVEMAMACGSTLCFYKLEYLQLSEVKLALSQHFEQLLRYNQHGFATLLRPLLQFVNILLAKEITDGKLRGDVLDIDEVEATENSQARLYVFAQKYSMILSFLFGNFEAAYDSLIKVKNEQGLGATDLAVSVWCNALVYLEIAKTAPRFQRIKLRRKAKGVVSILSKAALYNPHLFLCRQFLVEAELYSNKPQAHSKFVAAIAAARHSTSLFMIAVTNERAARFYTQKKDFHNARISFAEALEHYEQWGAVSKAKLLREEVSSLALEGLNL